jgi:hypothetical protein
VVNSRIVNNEAFHEGGGLWVSRSAPVDNTTSELILVNSLFAGNVADGDFNSNRGGGIFGGYLMKFQMHNCTVTDNRALHPTTAHGGGLSIPKAISTPAAIEITNSIIWGNFSASNEGHEIYIEYHDLVQPVTYSDIRDRGPTSGDVFGVDIAYRTNDNPLGTNIGNALSNADNPDFVDIDGPDDDPSTWQDNDYRLTGAEPGIQGSPCIDAGDSTLPNVGPPDDPELPQDTFDLDEDGLRYEWTPDLDITERVVDDPATDNATAGGIPLVPDGCDIIDMGAYENREQAVLLTVTAEGRYLRVTPNAGNQRVALLVTGDPNDPDIACVSSYLQSPDDWPPEAAPWAQVSVPLGENPVYMTSAEWGTVYTVDAPMRHYKNLTVWLVDEACPDAPFSPVFATMWRLCDVTNDGMVDQNDMSCIIAAFAGCNTEETCYASWCPTGPPTCVCSYYAHDQSPPCGFFPYMGIDVDDIALVLACFPMEPNIEDPCTGPCSGSMGLSGGSGPEGAATGAFGGPEEPQVIPEGSIELVGYSAPADALAQGDAGTEGGSETWIVVDVYLSDVNDLHAYQVGARASDSAGTALDLIDVSIDKERADFVFFGQESVTAVDRIRGRLAGVLFTGGEPVGEKAYLGTLTFRAPLSGSAPGQVAITIAPEHLLLRDSARRRIAPTVSEANME